ncbi:MAG: hypothetical protein HC879_12990 [Leptolyngbyaceae cyanobacterium SL_5_9]|nr:hypothetical protein [Leptolyngbyaceae cyanobacterium SL_5_9]NJO75869.1 hypothetical protein [Leptolyngbyaceae cyanobacterium RM1_406_9]
MESDRSIQPALYFSKFKSSIWALGIPSWMFGITDRGFAAFADGYLSAIEIAHLFTASFFFISWLFLKPEKEFNPDGSVALQAVNSNLAYCRNELSQCVAQGNALTRMFEIQEHHLISQEYILPFPHLCQIYHLLNLKHLENVHHFSLNNLRVIAVNDFQPTEDGGTVRFQTVLDSPFNALRIWRQPIVEVELTLHTPHTVELKIPVYNDKSIIVMFNVLPLSDTEHKLFIDIYSDLRWPKPLLQAVLHLASCLTLFEDLPYLRKLAERNIGRLFNRGRTSDHDTMWLFNRFVDLYGSSSVALEAAQLSEKPKRLEAAEA